MAQILIRVTDDRGLIAEEFVALGVNAGPVIDSIVLDPANGIVNPGGVVTITINAHDPEGGPITYAASADFGSVVQDPVQPNVFRWTAP